MIRKVSRPTPIKNTLAIRKKMRKQIPLVSSIKTECTDAFNAFSTTRKTAVQNGIKPVPSILKGVSGFAKQVGPIPFVTTTIGIITLFPMTGLVTGLVAKKGINKTLNLISKVIKK